MILGRIFPGERCPSLGLAAMRHPGSKPELLGMRWTPQTLRSLPEAGDTLGLALRGQPAGVAGVNLSADMHRVPRCMRSTSLAKLTDFLNFLHECPPKMRQAIMF